MSDTPRKSNSEMAAILAIIVVLPLVYILSVGPVVYALEKLHVPRSFAPHLQAFYAPILWLHDHTSLKQPIHNYISWWEAKGQR